MKTYKNLWKQLISYENLEAAFRKAKKGKTSYEKVYSSFEGWLAYARQGNTSSLRGRIIKKFECAFVNQIAAIEIGRWLKAANSAQIEKLK